MTVKTGAITVVSISGGAAHHSEIICRGDPCGRPAANIAMCAGQCEGTHKGCPT